MEQHSRYNLTIPEQAVRKAVGFIPEHNEADTATKQAARTFGFPVHVRVILFDVGLPQLPSIYQKRYM